MAFETVLLSLINIVVAIVMAVIFLLVSFKAGRAVIFHRQQMRRMRLTRQSSAVDALRKKKKYKRSTSRDSLYR